MPTPHSCESLIFLFQKYYGLEGDKRTSAESRLCWQAGLVMYWTISTGLESPSHSSHALCDEASVSSEVLSSPSLWGSHSQNYALGWSSHKADVRAVLNYDFNCTETEMCEMYSATDTVSVMKDFFLATEEVRFQLCKCHERWGLYFCIQQGLHTSKIDLKLFWYNFKVFCLFYSEQTLENYENYYTKWKGQGHACILTGIFWTFSEISWNTPYFLHKNDLIDNVNSSICNFSIPKCYCIWLKQRSKII